jgi:hypothetical protein
MEGNTPKFFVECAVMPACKTTRRSVGGAAMRSSNLPITCLLYCRRLHKCNRGGCATELHLFFTDDGAPVVEGVFQGLLEGDFGFPAGGGGEFCVVADE